MKHRKHLGILLLLPAMMLIQSCSNGSAESKSMEQIHAEEGLPVKVESLKVRPLASSFSAYAVLSGIQESTASAAVGDKIDSILFQVGDRVEKDAVVITFPTDNPAAQYQQAKVNVEHMKTTLDRMKNLYESGGVSRQEYDNVAAQYKVAEANWDAVQQTVKVRAPISGIITRIDVQESNNVHSGDALFTVSQTGELKAQLWIPENRIADVEKGAEATATWNGQVLHGRVSQVDLSLNTGMQAFGVQVIFDNRQAGLPSGINAEIAIFPRSTENALVTERKNLVKENDQFYAYKIEGQKAVRTPVTIGRQVDLDVEILEGLTEGDTILTEGLALVTDGQTIRIVK